MELSNETHLSASLVFFTNELLDRFKIPSSLIFKSAFECYPNHYPFEGIFHFLLLLFILYFKSLSNFPFVKY